MELIGTLNLSKTAKQGRLSGITYDTSHRQPGMQSSSHSFQYAGSEPTTGRLAGGSQLSRLGLFGKSAWTRSNGSAAARVYERLTKASRRRVNTENDPGTYGDPYMEACYRQGVYDAINALQKEIG